MVPYCTQRSWEMVPYRIWYNIQQAYRKSFWNLLFHGYFMNQSVKTGRNINFPWNNRQIWAWAQEGYFWEPPSVAFSYNLGVWGRKMLWNNLSPAYQDSSLWKEKSCVKHALIWECKNRKVYLLSISDMGTKYIWKGRSALPCLLP